MNKADLVAQIAQEADLSRVKAGEALDAILLAIQQALAAGDEVTLAGFGRFSVVQRGARQGRNPLTGKAILIPPSKAPKFKPGKQLKEAVK